jgi:hypothetical protein
MKGFVLLGFISLFFCSGCNLQKKEEMLQKKEDSLNKREQELLLKENALQVKEQEIMQREQNLDSAVKKDTAIFYNSAIVGTWLVKMTCTETSCAGSAIGDTKTEQWIISYEGNSVIAKAMAGDKLVRVYNGTVNGNEIQLAENTENNSSVSGTKMVITLTLHSENSMNGTREITLKDDCKVVYGLEMKKQ